MRRLTHRLAALVVASLVLAALSVTLPFVAPDPATVAAAEEPAVFDPLTNAQSQGPSVYGHVATDGAGSFYAVNRVDLPVGQYISVRKSIDDGRTWQTIALFQGTGGGATRPQLSVSGDHVAVAYIGGYCFPGPGNLCGEAPYLAVSDNGGASFGGPRRLDQQAFDVQVAQDSDRTWVAWERGGSMQLRMTFDGGTTWEQDRTVDRAVTGQLAAGDGVAVFAYFVNALDPDDQPSTWALVADLDELAPTATPIEPGLDFEVAYPMDAAAGGGRVHVVTRSGMKNSNEDNPPFVQVHSAGTDGSFGDRVPFGDDPWAASIAAENGTVALAVGTEDGVTAVATSADGGVTFSDPVPVTSSVDGGAPIVELGLAKPVPDKPIARFSWSVADRFVDQDGDGFVDPANDTGIVSGDSIRVWAGRTLDVAIDACASVAPEGRTIVEYEWSELLDGGGTRPLPLTDCSGTLEMEDGQRMEVRLDVTDSGNRKSSAVQTVEPRDYVIASLGDSVASGEGNPHVPGTLGTPNQPVWQDRSCHRSVDAGPAVAAARLEVSDPHSSVTFVQLACSGAAVLDSPDVPGDDPRSGGVIDQYDGQEPEAGSLRPSQVDQLHELLGLREVDSLLLSIGANDTRFSDTLKTCIKSEIRCDTTSTRTDFEDRLATLPDRYARLDAALDDIDIDPADVYITEYFDPAVDHRGVTQMRCAITGGLFDLLDDDEARWASTGVTGGLNAAVASAAAAHGWNLVGGLAQAFRGHGYCSDDPWIVRWAESWANQDNEDGAFHPNGDGHSAYADAIYRNLRADLLVPPPADPQGVAVGPQALGSMMVLSATNGGITVTALRDTGGTPEILGSRLIDRVVSGPGGLGISSPPAVSSVAAVGSWTQLPRLGTTQAEQLLAQLAVKPNVAVRTVEIMQAPRGERYLVTDRETTVLAILDATLDTPTEVTVNLQASVLGSGEPDDPGRPLFSTSQQVLLQPGLNSVLLDAEQTFELQRGDQPVATVTVVDPDGADPADSLDNELSTDAENGKYAIETRPLVAQMLTTPVSTGEVTCTQLSAITRQQISFANEVLPVSGPGVFPLLSCSEYPPVFEESEDGIVAYINMLDALARRSHVDVMVSVVPGGWLKSITGGAVGVAVPGRRAVMIEATAPKMVLAHEIAHSFGVEHVEGTPEVTGVDVLRRTLITGVDYLAERTPARSWTGPGTWDTLTVAIGPPGGVPDPPAVPDPLPEDFEFGGTIDDDGTVHPADPVPGDTRSPRRPSGGANLSRMLFQQTAADEVVSSEGVPLEEISGMYAPDATDTGPLGWSYFHRATLQPGVTGVQFVLDGEIVQQHDVVPAPDVTVTAPVASTVTARGRTLTVSWTTTAGPDARATVLASQDGGTTFKPLAVGVTGTSADIVVPRDIAEGSIIVRVLVQDGMVAGQADSEPFAVETPAGFIPEKVVAVRHDRTVRASVDVPLPPYPGKGLYTMNPDGTEFTEIVPMVPPVNGVGGMVPLHPDWRGDAQAIAFDGEVSGRRDLYVVNPDGSGQRQITNASSRPDGEQFVCADWHPNGRDLLSFATSGFGQQAWMRLVTVNTETGDVEDVGGWGTSSIFFPPWDIACPRWSDDGNEIVISLESRATGSGQDADILVIDLETLESKYRYSVNAGSIESPAHTTWLNFAPGDEDRFLTNQRLFSSGYLMVAELQDQTLFVPDPVTVKMPRPAWSTEFVDPINQADPKFGSAGFTADGNNIWFTSTNLMFPTQTRKFASSGFSFWYNIETDSVGHFCRMPVGGTTAICYLPGGDGTPVDSIDDGLVREPSLPLPSPATGIIQADVHPEITQAETSPPVVVENPDTVPADPQEPPPADVDTPSPEAPPAPGADDRPPVGAPIPEPTTFVVPAGRTTSVVLRDSDGDPAPAAITQRPLDRTVDMIAATPKAADPLATGGDAAILITPAPGYAGTITFQVTAPGGSPVTITVQVLGPPTPTAVDDTITVDAGSRIVIQPDALLANDIEPAGPGLWADGVAPLAAGSMEIVSVYGYTGGRSTLRADGSIDVETTSPTGGTFQYVAGVSGSTGSSTATVRVTLTEIPPPVTPPPVTPPPAPTNPGLRFEPVGPNRLADTRRSTPVPAGGTLEVVVVDRGGVPADTAAVALSVTAVGAADPGFLTVFPCGDARPNTSSVNYATGDTVANAVTASVGARGAVCVYSQSRTDVIVDVNGYWSSKGSGRFTPVTPTRLVDSRTGTPVSAGSVSVVDVSKVVPADSSAAVLNVTAVEAGRAGYLTVFPCGGPPPDTSNLNVGAGGTVAVSVIAGRGTDGTVCVFSSITTDLVVDATGWVGTAGAGSLQPNPATRLLDTRQGAGVRAAAGSVTRFAVPAGSTGELLNVAALDPAAASFLTVFPCGSVPVASNVNVAARQNRANQVIIGSSGAEVCIYTQASTHLLVDRIGRFVAPPS